MSARLFLPLLAGFVLLPLGCSPADSFPELHPLTGTVTRDGKPVAGGGIIFIPDAVNNSSLVVNASVNPDGTFEARTEHTGRAGLTTRPGAPVGRYKAIYHPPGDGSKMGLEIEIEPRVTVEAKANTAPLVLPTKPPEEADPPKDKDKQDVPPAKADPAPR